MSPTIETITRVTPLGVRFVDEPTGATITDGLRVGYPIATGDGRGRAFPTPSGAFAMAGIPGLRETEFGEGDDAFWAAAPASATIDIEVDDALGRFHSCSFSADVPYRGLFELPCAQLSPAEHRPPAVPLFSTPARTPPAGLAAVRAEIVDAGTGLPASFAVLEVRVDPEPAMARGVADANGRVLALVAYPAPPDGLSGVPRALTSARWTLQVDVRFAPGAVTGPHPDVCAALTQPYVSVVALSPPTPPTLAYGRDAVLQSGGKTVLLVTP